MIGAIIAIVALAVHGVFAGFSAALSAVDRIRIHRIAEDEGSANAAQVLKYFDAPGVLIATSCLSAVLTLLAGTVALHAQTGLAWIAVLIAVPAFLIVGEVAPRSIALIQPVRFLYASLPVVTLTVRLVYVLAWPLAMLAEGLRRMLGAPRTEIGAVMTSEAEFLSLVDESAAAGGIDKEEQEMIHSVLDLQTTQVKEIMVPRTDIQAIPDTSARNELVELLQKSGLTRLPVYHESLDDIVGVVNAYDVLLDSSPEDADIRRFAREVLHVPDTMDAGRVLQTLKAAGQHMAIVTDEYGGTDGIITLEDALEEIFGEIHDEHDRAMDMIRQVGPRGFVIDARMPLEDLEKHLGLDLQDEEVETIGGWVIHAAGRIPDQGEKIKHRGVRVTILEGMRHQITKIRLDVLDDHFVLPEQGTGESAEA